MESNIQTMASSESNGVSVHTGFPNPALDQRGRGRPLALDINQLLVQHPSSTYLFRIKGHTWADQGIYDGDIAVVDKAANPEGNDLVICWQESGFHVARRRSLMPDEEPLGVITSIIHQYRYADHNPRTD